MAKPPPMFGIDTVMFGPLRPRSKSRAAARSSARSGRSRCASPGGSVQAVSKRSCNHDDALAPRFAETASWTGPSACIAMKITPIAANGAPSAEPRSTAPTTTPMAMANAAGSSPRNTTSDHHAMVERGSAAYSTPPRRHSADLRSRFNPAPSAARVPPASGSSHVHRPAERAPTGQRQPMRIVSRHRSRTPGSPVTSTAVLRQPVPQVHEQRRRVGRDDALGRTVGPVAIGTAGLDAFHLSGVCADVDPP